ALARAGPAPARPGRPERPRRARLLGQYLPLGTPNMTEEGLSHKVAATPAFSYYSDEHLLVHNTSKTHAFLLSWANATACSSDRARPAAQAVAKAWPSS